MLYYEILPLNNVWEAILAAYKIWTVCVQIYILMIVRVVSSVLYYITITRPRPNTLVYDTQPVVSHFHYGSVVYNFDAGSTPSMLISYPGFRDRKESLVTTACACT